MTLNFYPVLEKPMLLRAGFGCRKRMARANACIGYPVAEIDPGLCGGDDFCANYGIEKSAGANCLIVEARRGGDKTYHACLAPVGFKMDLAGTLRKHLAARQVSLAPLDFVLQATQMEFGSITPIGLPKGWRIFLDTRLADEPCLIIGGGLRKSKIQLPFKAMLELPEATVMEGLARPAEA